VRPHRGVPCPAHTIGVQCVNSLASCYWNSVTGPESCKPAKVFVMNKPRPPATGWTRPPRPELAERDDIDIGRRETAELAYLIARDEWLAVHAPELVNIAPSHDCTLSVPGAASGDEVNFDELDEHAGLCGARWLLKGRFVFGAPDEVIRAVVGDEAEEAWVVAAVRAVRAERTWARRSRRGMLEVWKGNGELVHLTATVNRESIQRWGLDWSRMGLARGIAGRPRPELPAIFLDTIDSVGFFKHMTKDSMDLWAVDVTDLWIENGPDGWYIIHGLPIARGRLRLLEGDWVSALRGLAPFVSRSRSGGGPPR
jgi:hypothetical protein